MTTRRRPTLSSRIRRARPMRRETLRVWVWVKNPFPTPLRPQQPQHRLATGIPEHARAISVHTSAGPRKELGCWVRRARPPQGREGRERIPNRLESRELWIVRQRCADWKHWAQHHTRRVARLHGGPRRIVRHRKPIRLQHRESAEPFGSQTRRIYYR